MGRNMPNKSKAKKTRGRGRPPSIPKRIMDLMKMLLDNQRISTHEALFIYPKASREKSLKLLTEDILYLQQSVGLPIRWIGNNISLHPVGFKGFLKGTKVGHRLNYDSSKIELAQQTLLYFSNYQDKPRNEIKLLLGTGTTVYEFASALFDDKDNCDVGTIYTNNLLIIYEHLFRRDLPIDVIMQEGTLDMDAGSIKLADDSRSLQEISVHVVITSFSGIDKDRGFYTIRGADINEKVMNLRPDHYCKLVLIPIEWWKIAEPGGKSDVVHDKNGREGPDLLETLNGERSYVIITNPPCSPQELRRKKQDVHKLDIMDYWNAIEGVDVVYTTDEGTCLPTVGEKVLPSGKAMKGRSSGKGSAQAGENYVPVS